MAIDGKSKDGVIEQSGTAAERIALDIEKVIQGSEFYETDTTARYKMYSGAWALVVATGGASSYAGGGTGGGGTPTVPGYTMTAPVAVAITAASTQIVPANPLRKYLLIQVNGAADVSVAPGAIAATLASGFVLSANANGAGFPGGTFSSAHVGAVQAIGRAASSITWSEGV